MDELFGHILRKKEQLLTLQPLPQKTAAKLDAFLTIDLAWTSNSLEGNSLSRQETELVITKGMTVQGKTIREHLEAKNHADAYSYIKTLQRKSRQDIQVDHVREINRLLLGQIDTQAGAYRKKGLMVDGRRFAPPKTIAGAMRELLAWIHRPTKEHPIALAAEAHSRLLVASPFADANGQTARLLLSLLVMQDSYPPVLIRPEEKGSYRLAVSRSFEGDVSVLTRFIVRCVDKTLDEALSIVQPSLPRQTGAPTEGLLKIGALAKKAGESVPTIRFWVAQGLLSVANFTKGGYQLFDERMVERAREVRQLQKTRRLTIAEIKKELP
ncbi:MAG: Fic family protein [bacterium]|nr:Fic family protein [bacterium]